MTDTEVTDLTTLLARQIERIVETNSAGEYSDMAKMWAIICDHDRSQKLADYTSRLIVAWRLGMGITPEELVYGNAGECLCYLREDGTIDSAYDLCVDGLPEGMSREDTAQIELC